MSEVQDLPATSTLIAATVGRYDEDHNQDLRHYVSLLCAHGHVFGRLLLPHDAGHSRLSADFNKSVMEMLQELMPGERFVLSELMTGILQTRKHLKGTYFDRTSCEKGIQRIEGY